MVQRVGLALVLVSSLEKIAEILEANACEKVKVPG